MQEALRIMDHMTHVDRYRCNEWRRRAQANAPAASHWLRHVLDAQTRQVHRAKVSGAMSAMHQCEAQARRACVLLLFFYFYLKKYLSDFCQRPIISTSTGQIFTKSAGLVELWP